MTLPVQVLSICTASLGLALALLGLRGLPSAAAAAEEQNTCTAPAPSSRPAAWTSAEQARALVARPDVVFVDCRPRESFLGGHIAGALSLPAEAELDAQTLQVLRHATTLVAYCDARSGCQSSARLAARLQEQGFSDVRILEGGLPGWLERGFPAESGTCRLCPALSEP